MSRLGRLDVVAFRAWLEESDFHGVVHVAGDDDEEPRTIAIGLADRAAGLPIHPGTRFGTASTTKLLTGLTVARLVDRGAFGTRTGWSTSSSANHETGRDVCRARGGCRGMRSRNRARLIQR